MLCHYVRYIYIIQPFLMIRRLSYSDRFHESFYVIIIIEQPALRPSSAIYFHRSVGISSSSPCERGNLCSIYVLRVI